MRELVPEINFGIYRDDGLGVHKRLPGPRLDRIRKDIIALFQTWGLKITIDTKLVTVNFLDVTFELHNNSYKPYRKPNDTPVYVNKGSNHPKTVLKEIHNSVNARINSISSTETLFEEAKDIYENALKESGHNSKLTFEQKTEGRQKRKRKRRNNILWFHPPYNMALKTNIGREFLKILDKNFPPNHILRPLLNRSTVKISYSCTENMGQIMKNHNKKVLTNSEKQTNQCNCRNKTTCPVPGKCQTECVVYKASVRKEATYIGATETTFKERHRNHTYSFRKEERKTNTTLSTFVWDKGLTPNPEIKWELLRQCKKYEPGANFCDLCLSEKTAILKGIKEKKCLNKRSDIGNKCVIHRKKHLLKNFKT